MAAPVCYVVRLNPSSPTSLDGIAIYDANGKAFNGASVGSGQQLCFAADTNASTSKITGFQVGVDSCGSCKVVSSSIASPLTLSFSPSIGNPDVLLLTGTSNGRTYSAARSSSEIDGGKPIIRNMLDLPLLVAVVVVSVAVVSYLAWRYLFRAKLPAEDLRKRSSGPT